MSFELVWELKAQTCSLELETCPLGLGVEASKRRLPLENWSPRLSGGSVSEVLGGVGVVRGPPNRALQNVSPHHILGKQFFVSLAHFLEAFGLVLHTFPSRSA